MDKNILSTRIKTASESATLEMTRRSRELKAQGIDIITLSIGEPDFNTPNPVKEAAKQAIDNNKTHYPPVAGFEELRKAIAHKLKRDNGLDFNFKQIVVSNGAKQSLANIFFSILNSEDEVIMPAPYWVSYAGMVKMAGGKSVLLTSTIENDFKVSPKQVEQAIGNKTKAFLINSPGNPSGSVYTREDLQKLTKVFRNHPDILIISDEIYEYINFGGQHYSIASFPEIKEQTVVVNGVSKGYAMTGWRIGYIAAPQFIADACNKLQGQYTSGASSISQMAALEAIENNPEGSEYLSIMRNSFRQRRDLLINALNKALPQIKTNIPDGAFYLFPDVRWYFGKSDGETLIRNSIDLAHYLLNKAHVAVVAGEAFGNPDNIRISYATSPELLLEAVRRMKPALDMLN